MELVSENLHARINHLLMDVETLLGISIMVRDYRGVLRTPDARPLIDNRPRHQHPYCERGRYQYPEWDAHCIDHCLHQVSQRAGNGAPFLTCCWKGVHEVVVPIMHENVLVIALCAGAFRSPDASDGAAVQALPPIYHQMHAALPEITPQRASTIYRLLYTCGVALLHEVLHDHGIQEDSLDRKTQIRRFIFQHAHESVSLTDLSHALCLSASRTSHLVHDVFGISFQQLILHERTARAQSLLLSTGYGLREIALRVGFRNEYYFNRQFTRAVGITPGQYRRMRAEK